MDNGVDFHSLVMQRGVWEGGWDGGCGLEFCLFWKLCVGCQRPFKSKDIGSEFSQQKCLFFLDKVLLFTYFFL